VSRSQEPNINSSGTESKSEEMILLDLPIMIREFNDLKIDLTDLRKEILKTETKTNWTLLFMGTVFVVTIIFIGIDYIYNNENRYEKFIDRTEEIEQNFYTKIQIDKNISLPIIELKTQFNDFRKCLRNGGWNTCF
jgi:hypothetical protein